MNTISLSLSAVLLAAASCTAHASESAHLSVGGSVIAGACSVSLDNAKVDFGSTRASDLPPGEEGGLGSPVSRTVEVSCTLPMTPTLTITDLYDGRRRAGDRDFVLSIVERPDLDPGYYRVVASGSRVDGAEEASTFSSRTGISYAFRVRPDGDDEFNPMVPLSDWKLDLRIMDATAPALSAEALAEELAYVGGFAIELGYL